MHTLSSLSFALILFLSTFSVNSNATKKLPKGFSIDLIHRDSPLSPFYNSSMTHSERVQNAALRSMSRANRFGQSSSSMAETSELVETDIIPNDANYLMKISVGTPSVERQAIADTGSDLIWFQCSPCPQCYPQKAHLFDPKSSSTYTSLSCSSEQCKSLPQFNVQGQSYPNCGTSNECTYFYSYGDKSYTIGELGTESLNFGQAASFPKTVFGCGHKNYLLFYQNTAGLVGLGQGPLSLVSQIGNVGRKFSYCLPPYGGKTTTKLRFGDEAAISGNGIVSTPLIARSDSQTYYNLNLEGFTVGQQRVPLTDQSSRNIIIDSGTTFTMLPSSFYGQVEAAVKQAIGADQLIVQRAQLKLCYTNANSIQNIPKFEVHFTGATLSLKPQNFFRFINNNEMCFTMLPTESGGLSIYGNLAQIDFEVEHDLDQKQVSFAPADCTTKQ